MTPPASDTLKLYISNVSPLATQEELEVVVRRIAPFKRLHLVRNMRHGLCARFAFLDIAPEHEETFRSGLDGTFFMDRCMGVLRVIGRPDRPGPDGV